MSNDDRLALAVDPRGGGGDSRKMAMNDTYVSEIREFIVSNFLFGKQGEFSDEQSFLESGIIDSTGLLELVSFVEERYGIAVADADLVPSNLDSLRNISRFVSDKVAAHG
jgi:acyl carrier protein